MPERKEQRNKEFYHDWRVRHLSPKELAAKYGLKLSSVHGLKGVLRLRYE